MFEYKGFTRFEIARIVSARTLQISMGAPALIKHNFINAKDIAMKEFEMNVLPITVKRTL